MMGIDEYSLISRNAFASDFFTGDRTRARSG